LHRFNPGFDCLACDLHFEKPTHKHIMATFILWIFLFLFAWPIALLALLLYPVVWLLVLPFRLIGLVFEGLFEFFRSLIMLPSRAVERHRERDYYYYR
jgi:polyferredoxin